MCGPRGTVRRSIARRAVDVAEHRAVGHRHSGRRPRASRPRLPRRMPSSMPRARVATKATARPIRSERLTLAMWRISATSIEADDRHDDDRRRGRRWGMRTNSGIRKARVTITMAAVTSEANGVRAPGGVVHRGTGESLAGHRVAAEQAGGDVRRRRGRRSVRSWLDLVAVATGVDLGHGDRFHESDEVMTNAGRQAADTASR